MKKIVSIVLMMFIVMTLVGCGDKNGGIFSKSLKVSDLSIDDFEWETTESKCYGSVCYVFTLTNNSKYDIIGVDFSYKVKSGVTESQLSVYNDFMKKHDGYIEEDDSPKDVTLGGSKNQLVAKGEQMTGLKFTVGFKKWLWYDYPTSEQFELMEPKELQIGVVGEDNKLYLAYYDFESKSWKLDENKLSVDIWPKTELVKKIEPPLSKHNVIVSDEEDEFEFYAYGVTEEEFENYVEKLKLLGFVDENPSSINYNGITTDGYEIDVWYDKDEQRLSVNLEKM